MEWNGILGAGERHGRGAGKGREEKGAWPLGEGWMTGGAAYLCVHLVEFPAQAMLRLRMELRVRAVAVVEGSAPLEKVCSVNRLAGKIGVRRGMTKAELDSFDGLTVLRRAYEEERSAKAAVMEVAGALSPRVEDHTSGPHATAGTCVMVLDVCGNERLFGPVDLMARRLVTALRTLGLVARVAVSENLLTSVVLARALEKETVRVVERGGEAAALAPYPLDVLKLTEVQAETFVAWGLRTIGELAALDQTELVIRMGKEGGALWRLARGGAEHLMVPVEAGLVLVEVVELETPVVGMESLMFVLGPMLDQLILRAGNRAMALASVTVTMDLDRHGGGADGEGGDGRGGEHVRVLKPALPVADRGLLLKLLHLDLEAHPPSAGVVRLRVDAEAGGRSPLQAGLFRPQMPESSRLEVTLARLAGLVGEARIGRAQLVDSHARESFTMERFVVPEEKLRELRGREQSGQRGGGAKEVWGREGLREDRLQEQGRRQQEVRQRHTVGSFPSGALRIGTTAQDASARCEGAVKTVEIEAAPIAKPVVITIGRVTGEDALDAGDGGTDETSVLSDANVDGVARNEVISADVSVGSERRDGSSNVLRMRSVARGALVGAFDGESELSGMGGGDVAGGVAGTAVVEPGFAVGVRRMRPPVPIRWKGNEVLEFWMQGVLYTVRERYGPWRRSGAWWTGDVWSEEEWDVSVEVGGGVRLLCMVTHDLLRDRWRMDAIYD